jgi:hypothetical protein
MWAPDVIDTKKSMCFHNNLLFLSVDMLEFPNMQNLQPLVVEEVPLGEMAPFENLVPNEPLPPSPQFDSIHLGFVETFIPPVDPIL